MRADSHMDIAKVAEKTREDFGEETWSIKGLWVLVKKGLMGKI